MHAVVLYNPVSGRGRAQSAAERAEAHLRSAGYSTERIATREPDGATGIAAEVAKRADLVVVAGGDGSLRETLSGLGNDAARIRVALVPLGNANVVARELGIPLDVDAAIAATTSRGVSALDIGIATLSGGDARSESQLFLGMVGVGWDALVARYVERIRRSPGGGRWYRLWADSVYFVAGLLATSRRQPRALRLCADGEATRHSYRAALACNTHYYGKGWSMAPGASGQSGRLHFQARKRSLLPWLAWHLLAAMWGRRSPRFISDYGSARELSIASQQRFAVQIDGDPRGTATRVDLRLRPAAVQIVTPSTNRD